MIWSKQKTVSHILCTLKIKHNMNAVVCQLTGCDFIVSSRMGVEKKTWSGKSQKWHETNRKLYLISYALLEWSIVLMLLYVNSPGVILLWAAEWEWKRRRGLVSNKIQDTWNLPNSLSLQMLFCAIFVHAIRPALWISVKWKFPEFLMLLPKFAIVALPKKFHSIANICNASASVI